MRAAPRARSTRESLESVKILLADDDPITLDALHACVAPDGFSALLARDGREALDLWERHRPDLLCLDIMMPHVDGYEVCRRVRASDAQVPVLFLSAKSEEIDVVVGLQLGADDFIRKPFGKHELMARIRTMLRRAQSRAVPARSFVIHDLVVYPRVFLGHVSLKGALLAFGVDDGLVAASQAVQDGVKAREIEFQCVA